jgi:pimeloyl-ACP methyl ester carboxylesterase
VECRVVPRSFRLRANGLEHHVLEWNVLASRGTLVLLHGYMDVAATWDLVAPALAHAGFRVLAPDLRGFGQTDRVPAGGYYHFPDYVADLAGLLGHLAPRETITLVGHSMGGTVASLYAGTRPEDVRALALLEGLGPPSHSPSEAPERMRGWIDDLAAHEGRPEPVMPDEASALRKLLRRHTAVPEPVLASRAALLLRHLPAGGVVWAFDPLHRTRSPMPFYADAYRAFAARVACPVLYVSGGSTGWHPADEEDRLSAFSMLEAVVLEGAGHMMHWTAPEALSGVLLRFLDAAAPPPD